MAVMVDQWCLPDWLDKLMCHLNYIDTLAFLKAQCKLTAGGKTCDWHPVLVFANGDSDIDWNPPLLVAGSEPCTDAGHSCDLVETLSPSGATILDPFDSLFSTGALVLRSGRRIVGCAGSAEIDDLQTWFEKVIAEKED